MITVSKVFHHVMLACKWWKDFMTRPTMSMKWGDSPARMRIVGGLWECEARNNPSNHGLGVLTPKPIFTLCRIHISFDIRFISLLIEFDERSFFRYLQTNIRWYCNKYLLWFLDFHSAIVSILYLLYRQRTIVLEQSDSDNAFIHSAKANWISAKLL